MADEGSRCENGLPGYRSPEMIHVWFIDRPKGPFTSSMYLRGEEIALLMEKRSAPRVKCAEALGREPLGDVEDWICTSPQ